MRNINDQLMEFGSERGKIRYIHCNICLTLIGHVDNRRSYAYLGAGTYGNSAPCSQFCCCKKIKSLKNASDQILTDISKINYSPKYPSLKLLETNIGKVTEKKQSSWIWVTLFAFYSDFLSPMSLS